MFIRKNKNRSCSVSIQIITKSGNRYKVVATVGCARTMQEEEVLLYKVRAEIGRLQELQSLFIEYDDTVVDNFVDSLCQDNLQIAGAEIIMGEIYDQIGYPQTEGSDVFRNGEIAASRDYEKFSSDNVWDGLKGYITNTGLTKKQVIGNYGQLWQIESSNTEIT